MSILTAIAVIPAPRADFECGCSATDLGAVLEVRPCYRHAVVVDDDHATPDPVRRRSVHATSFGLA